MREIPVITKELTDAAENAKKSKQAYEDAVDSLNKAGIAYTEAQNKVGALRNELHESLEVLIPGIITPGNVRQS